MDSSFVTEMTSQEVGQFEVSSTVGMLRVLGGSATPREGVQEAAEATGVDLQLSGKWVSESLEWSFRRPPGPP